MHKMQTLITEPSGENNRVLVMSAIFFNQPQIARVYQPALMPTSQNPIIN